MIFKQNAQDATVLLNNNTESTYACKIFSTKQHNSNIPTQPFYTDIVLIGMKVYGFREISLRMSHTNI